MKAGIIGAGNIGCALAVHLKRVGYQVLIANSRGPETLKDIEVSTGATPVHLNQAVKDVDVLVLTIPSKGVHNLSKELITSISPKTIIIDTCNYYPSRDGKIVELETHQMTESEWVSGVLNHSVIKVFNSIITDSLINKGTPKGTPGRVSLPVSGDDEDAKKVVLDLVDSIGFDAFDAGPLSESWRQQPGMPAYCVDPNRNQLKHLLNQGDIRKAAGKRDQARKTFENLSPSFPQSHLVQVSRLFVGIDVWNPKSYFSLARLAVAMIWK